MNSFGMNTGTIKFFNATKGFGFVTPDDGGADLFLPAATVTAAGVTAIKPGQRITFEQAPDTKGPKIVSLKLVGDPPAPASAAERVTVYCDASADASADVIEAARDSGFPVIMQNYMTAPPGVDQLKRLSRMLSAAGQSLVRRYDSLFLALQLDDRFITDQDFWTAIVEHPSLINGPVLVVSGQVRICKTAGEVRAFLRKDEASASPAAKTLSPRIAAMLRGETPPSIERKMPVEPPAPAPVPVAKPSPEKKTRAARPAAKPKSAVEPKSAAKPKRAAKPAKAVPKKAAPKKAAKPATKTKKRVKK